MPLISIQTSLEVRTDDEILLNILSKEISKLLSKPESYVMTILKTDLKMTFAGTSEPSCFIEVKNIGTLDESKTKQISESLCALVQKHLHIASTRIYISFENVRPHMWGWDGSTF